MTLLTPILLQTMPPVPQDIATGGGYWYAVAVLAVMLGLALIAIRHLYTENQTLQKAAVRRAEEMTQKLADALHAVEDKFDKNTQASEQTNRLLERLLDKFDKR